ncbi:ZP domain-containing protein [Trichonephila clavata]|uniref:ZP domain-containing protein n=1 Tax=Trichonephila clavata TaxID=2740835 RepID=A0A8X6LMG5_TRICU|nr:ZP domain-containing protein [Trichonephila clavata]
MILLLFAMTSGLVSAGTHWGHNHNHHLHDNLVEERAPKPHINRLDVVCSKDHMTVHMFFEDPFYGVVFSHSSPNHERCVHVGPRAGVKDITFHIRYDGCGTIEDLTGQFHENTIVIQYGEDILEAWDEAKRLRCEWLESFDKKSSKPVVAISDIETVELNFQGDDIDCWMEVQEGKGPWARQVGGLVPIGSPLTLVIAINDNSREFDMRVKQCTASDGTGSEIQLTDQSGCVLRPSLLTPFAKIRDFGGKATLVAYSHLFAFKFPDNLDVFVHCIVEVCRHGCPESCGGRSPTEYHPHLRENLHSLESKKHQKLVQLTKSKPAPPVPAPAPALATAPVPAVVAVQKEEISNNRPRLQYLTQVPVHILQKSKSGSDTSKELILLAERQLRQQTLSRNVSTSFSNKDISHTKPASIASNFRGPTDETKISKKPKSEVQSAASNIHLVSEDTKSHTHQGHPDVKPVPIGHYHKIIGHDAHWHSEEVKLFDEQHLKHHIPPAKNPSLAAPQPEPSAWSADEVKSLTKDEVFNPHGRPKNIDHHHIQLKHEISKLPQVPQPEPAAWSADEVKPLTKDEVFNPHAGLKTIDHHHHHHVHLKHETSKFPQIPQPEPAAWSADDVKPLTKQEVFRPHISEHHINHFKEELGRLALSKEVIDEHRHPIAHVPQIKEPKPEPAPWTFEEVRPMHNPGLLNIPIEKERLQEPKPEPAPWSADEVKPLSKEDLKTHSLNYKLKTHSHESDSLPVYKESVHPHLPNPVPIPVYVPKYTPSAPSMPMTGPMMMKMMMTMPTLLPFTYQTARWPQKSTTGRHLRADKKQHYPYPIPQFTHRQQMMMSVIADRRMDVDEGDLQFEMDPRSHMNLTNSSTLSEMYEKLYLSGLSGTEKPEETTVTSEISDKEFMDDKHEVFHQQTEITTAKDPSESILEESRSRKNQATESSGAIRPPISGFVQPSLDIDELSKHESSDRSVHTPRALNRRRRSSEPVFGVKQKFQAIALSDLAFDLNLTRDSTAVFKGRREEIIYGICMSPASMSAGIGFILILILCSLIASLMLYEHSYRLRNKTSHLSLLTRTFNGRLEPLYRVTRPHPNSSIQEMR